MEVDATLDSVRDDKRAAGVIRSIQAVQVLGWEARRPGVGILYPASGTARLTPTTQSDGPEYGWQGFVGYLVELEAEQPAKSA